MFSIIKESGCVTSNVSTASQPANSVLVFKIKVERIKRVEKEEEEKAEGRKG